MGGEEAASVGNRDPPPTEHYTCVACQGTVYNCLCNNHKPVHAEAAACADQHAAQAVHTIPSRPRALSPPVARRTDHMPYL
jgi:hypothetical protein